MLESFWEKDAFSTFSYLNCIQLKLMMPQILGRITFFCEKMFFFLKKTSCQT